jgi:hypothetical protein
MTRQSTPGTELAMRYLQILTFVALVAASVLLVREAPRAEVWPMDSYFYLSKAESLARGHGLSVPWAEYGDPKYFPGYSIALALAFIVCGFQAWYWIALQVGVLWVSAALMRRAALGITGLHSLAWGAALVWVTNPMVLKWLTVPLAEGLAVALALGAICVYQSGVRRPRRSAALMAGLLGGFAISTRVEMTALGGALLLHWIVRRRATRSRWLLWGAVGLLLGLSPVIFWILFTHGNPGGPRLSYISEYFEHGPPEKWWHFIHVSLLYMAFLTPVPTGSDLIEQWLLLVFFGLLLAIALGAVGWLGPWGTATVVFLFAYITAHSLWHYFYDRFLVPAVAIAALLWVAGGRRWLLGPNRSPRGLRWRRAAGLLILTANSAVWLHEGTVLQLDHRMNLARSEPWHPARLAAQIRALTPEGTAVLTDLGPPLAYHLHRPVFFDQGLTDYYEQSFPRSGDAWAIVAFDIHAVATRQTPEDFFAAAAVPAPARRGFHVVSDASNVTLLLVDPKELGQLLSSEPESITD